MTKPPKHHESENPDDPAALSFEQAFEALEGIVADIESGRIGLEESIARYERGLALVARCRDVLSRAEQRVADLTARMNHTDPSGGER